MLTPNEITDLVSRPVTAVTRGRARAMANREERYSSGSTQRTRQFATDMATAKTPDVEVYNHPGAGHLPVRDEGPLAPAEQAWLQQLPRDPSQITYDDAQALAAISATLPSMKYPADRRLLDSTWKPVKEIHDRAAAQVQLRNAQLPQPTVPSSALGAMADAIAAQNPNLEPDDAIGRAGRALQDAATARAEHRAELIFQAQTKLDEINLASQRRTAVTV